MQFFMFRVGAGVLNKLREILPLWTAPKSAKRPQELYDPVIEALACYFTGCAQKMAVIKAIQKEGGTGPLLLTKLCIHVNPLTHFHNDVRIKLI